MIAGVVNPVRKVGDVARTTLPVPVTAHADGTPVLVVLHSGPVARLERATPLIPTTVVAPPVDVLVASPVRAVNDPDPPTAVGTPLWHV